MIPFESRKTCSNGHIYRLLRCLVFLIFHRRVSASLEYGIYWRATFAYQLQSVYKGRESVTEVLPHKVIVVTASFYLSLLIYLPQICANGGDVVPDLKQLWGRIHKIQTSQIITHNELTGCEWTPTTCCLNTHSTPPRIEQNSRTNLVPHSRVSSYNEMATKF